MNEELKIIIRAVTDEARKNMAAVREELEGIQDASTKSGKAVDGAMKGIGKGAMVAVGSIVALTGAMVALGKSSMEFQKSYGRLIAGFQSSGSTIQQATETYKDLFRFLGEADTATEAANLLVKLTNNSEDLAEWTTILQGVYTSFPDSLPVEALAEAANETARTGVVTGNLADALNWAGGSEADMNAALAQTTSLQEREALLRSTLNGLYGEAAALYERNNASTLAYNESQVKLDMALASATQYVIPLMTYLNNLGAVLLQVLKPAIETVSAVMIVFCEWIIAAIEAIGSFFGIFGEEGTKANEAVAQSVNNATNGVANLATGYKQATKAAEALKKQTMGFDELNVVSSQSTAATGDAGAGAGGGAQNIKIPTMDPQALAVPGLDGFQEKVDEVRKSLEIFLPILAAGAVAWAGWNLTKWIHELGAADDGIIALKKAMDSFGISIKGIKFTQFKAGLKALGAKMLPIAAIALLVAGIALVVSGIKDVVENGYSMEAVLKIAAGAILIVVGAVLLFNAALLANPITWIVIAIIALVAAFVILWNECEGFRNFWIGLWEHIKAAFAAVVESLKPLFNAIVGAFKEAWELIKVIWDLVAPYFAKAWEGIKMVWNGVKPYFQMIWDNIKIVFSVVKDVLGAYFTLAWEKIKITWNQVISYFTAIWNTIKGIFSVVKNVLSGNWKGAWDAIKGIVGVWKDYFANTWNNIKKIFSAVGTFFSSIFSSAWEGIKKIFGNWSKFFDGIWDGLKKGLKGALNWMIGIVNKWIDGLNLLLSPLRAIIYGVAKAFGASIKFDDVKIPKIPKLATGGIVTAETLARIGEGGKKEAVLPLEQNTGWMDTLADRIASRNNTPSKIVLMLDKRELGHATIDSFNNVNGALQLKLV